ncbi:MAG: diguanylate cyclase [Chloroflexi bacterium]|nr:diguanylate cyclase [Chloroflexota bacterium]
MTSLRRTDVIVRYEDQVALVLLPITEAALARAVAIRLSRTLSALMIDETTPLSVAIGIAAYPQHGETPETLLASASKALSQAQHTGTIVGYGQV